MENTKARTVRQYWNSKVADWKIATHPPGTREFFEEIEGYRFEKLEYLEKRVDYAGYADKDVLDVGCGVGNDTARFAEGGAHVTAIDISPRAIELTECNFRQRRLPGRFLLMDAEQMSFADATFDLVYCHTVLQFTPRPPRLVEECYRVLKPGGRLIIMAINQFSWLNMMHRLFRVQIDHLDAPCYHRHSKKQLLALLGQFEKPQIFEERYPVVTKVHGGWKAALFNGLFVPIMALVPPSVTRSCCHHLLAVAHKSSALS